jgi:hypothetical protein
MGGAQRLSIALAYAVSNAVRSTGVSSVAAIPHDRERFGLNG